MKPRRSREKPSLELIEEAVNLLLGAPRASWAAYLAGAVPFLLALLFFWNDMSHSAFAEHHLVGESLVVALAFFWMKCWQSVFARSLLASARGESTPAWNGRRTWRLAVSQTWLHATGLFVLPVALVLAIPFGWVFAFYQNVTVLGAADCEKTGGLVRSAMRQSFYAPRQNHCALALFAPFALIVFLNLGIVIVVAPQLLKTFFGIETAFSRDVMGMFNFTLIAAICAAAYVCLDPIVKTIYVLRCFYGLSQTNGDDLLIALKRITAKKSAALLCLLALFAVSGNTIANPLTAIAPSSQKPVPSASQRDAVQFDHTIRDVLQRPEFAWRMPREQIANDEPESSGFFLRIALWCGKEFHKFSRALGKMLDAIGKWFSRDKSASQPESHGFSGWMESLRPLMWTLIALGCALLAFVGWRALHRKQNRRAAEIVAQPAVALPDLNEEQLTADQLPEDRWLALAREMEQKGELRLALRALYLAVLAHLGAREIITIERCKSNREYERELSRRARLHDELRRVFAESVRLFERSWYGMHEVTRDRLSRFEFCLRRIQQC